MTELIPSNDPAYVNKLALNAAPFNQTIEIDRFYRHGQAGQRFDLLLHTIRASDALIQLLAPSGYGKSTLLAQLSHQTGDELRLCLVDADQHRDLTTILGQCLLGMQVTSEQVSTTNNPIQLFKNQLDKLGQLDIKVVLLIDNADSLSSSLLAELADWFEWRSETGFLMQAVLASRKELEFAASIHQRLHTIQIPAMTDAEVSEYIAARLSSVGYRGETLFNKKQLKHISQLSKGNPVLVNQLAHQQLMGGKISSAWGRWHRAFGFKTLRPWAGLATITALIILFVELPNEFSSATENLSEQTILLPEQGAVTTVTIDERQQRQELAQLIADIPEPSLRLTPRQENIATKPSKKPSTRPKNESQSLDLIEPLAGEAWIRAQEPFAYTYQLMGTWERREITEFISQYDLSGDLAMFESKRNNRTWYVLVYGSFVDKPAALAARAGWEAPFNSLPVWLRQFQQVHQQIKNKVVMSPLKP